MELLKRITQYNRSFWETPSRYDTPPNSSPTQFMMMSVDANKIPAINNVLAGLSSWITCAGFVTLPNTFTSLRNSSSLEENVGGRIVQDAIRNLQLLPFNIFCLSGLIGTCFLWRSHKTNYIWLIDHLFM
jgi:hypothetical protein